MNRFKEALRSLIRLTGYELSRYKATTLGESPYQDMCRFLRKTDPIVFDIGANVGQTIKQLKHALPTSTIYAFEPSPSTFKMLEDNCQKMSWDDVHIHNCGVGSSVGELNLVENEQSYMSSFLHPGRLCTGKISKETTVDVITVDGFTKDQGISFIDILKVDTQGYEFEVFKGADELIRDRKIAMIYFEFTFSDMYEHLPPFSQVWDYLVEREFVPVSFYKPHFQEQRLSWTDFLFIDREYHKSCIANSAKERVNGNKS